MTLIQLMPQIVEPLGWLLVHSVWQFALIALMALLLERALQRASAAVRYGMLLAALGAMLTAPVLTWFMLPPAVPSVSVSMAEMPSRAETPQDTAHAPVEIVADETPLPVAIENTPLAESSAELTLPSSEPTIAPTAHSRESWWSWADHQLRPWLNSLVIAWGIGASAFALRPLLSWLTVRRLKVSGVSPVPAKLLQLVRGTAERLGIKRAVTLLQSTLARTPCVVGYFRPVILLPVSVVSGLPLTQLEAILAHELAHIRRHDYLVNLVQTLVETVFFYHPAIWWISHRIRVEREHCCDDIAVALLGNKVEYGRSLLALEQTRGAASALAMSAGGGSLLARVRRLFGFAPSQAFGGGSVALVGLLAAVTIAVAVWATVAKEPDQGKKEGVVVKVPGSHTLDVALSPDGKMLARAGTSRCELWDVASGKQLHTLKGNPHFYKVAFSPDGKTLGSIGGDVRADKFEVEVKLWDTATGKERVLGQGHPIKAGTMAFSPDSKTLATSYLDPAAVKLWDVATGKEKMELAGAWGSLAFSPDGKTLAVGDKSVHLWDLTTGKKRVSLARKEDWLDVRPFAYSDVLGFSPDGKTLVSAGLHQEKDDPKTLHAQLTVWDVATAKERATIAIPGYSAPNAPPVVFTADSKTVITAVWIFEKDKATPMGRVSVQQWDLATGKARATYWTPVNPGGNHPEAGHVVGFYYAALSADGKSVAWGGAEGPDEGYTGTAHVWEVGSLATSPPEIPKELKEAEEAEQAKQKDIEDLQGTWKLRAVEGNGRRQDPKHLQTQMRIDPSVLTLDTPEDHKYPWANYQIDASRQPKTIDMVFTAKSSSPVERTYISFKAIYLLDGDRLTICRGRERTLPEGRWADADTEPRPTEFKTQPDDGLTLEIYERVTEREQAEGTFSLQMPAQAIFVKPGAKKTVTLGSRRGEKFEEDVTLTFADVPKGVTFEPANPVIKHPGTQAEFTIQTARDADLGDFAIKVTESAASGHARENQLNLSVDPAGEEAREQPGKPPRRYLRPSRDPFTGTFDFSMAADETAQDGEVLSVAGGKLVIKSKDGTEHSYTPADNAQITYQNARAALEPNPDVNQILEPGMIVRVTAKKAKPQEATRIEGVYAYDAFMAEYEESVRQKEERERQKKEQQEIEHQKKVQQDTDHLQGTWRVVSSQTGDDKEPEESVKKQRVIIKGDHLTLAFGNEQSEKREGTIKIDPQKKSLDWVTPMAGDAAMQAIYELNGDDLKIGFGVDGLLRPTRFEMGKDQVGWLLVLKRAPPHWKPGEISDQKEFTKLVVGTWRENRIRPGMKEPQILNFTANGDFEFFIADAKGGRWIKARYDVRSAYRIWLDKLTENLDSENRRSIMQLVLTRGEGKSPDTLRWIWPLEEMGGTYERVEEPPAEKVEKNASDADEAKAKAAEDKAAEAIEKLGGKVTRDDKLPGKPVTGVDLNGPQVTDAGLKELADLKLLTSLNLAGCTLVTGAGLKELKDLKQLTTLWLNGTGVTDAGMKELAHLTQLTTLRLMHTQVTNAGLAELKDLKQLTTLDLIETKVTDAGLKELADLKQLTTLYLRSTKVTDAGLKELKHLKQLTLLDLQSTSVTDAGLTELTDLKQLTSLWVNGTKVTGEGARELQAALPKLKIDGAPELKEVVAKRKAAAEKKKEIEDRQIRMQLREGELYLTGHTVVSDEGYIHDDGWYRVCVSADGKRLLTIGLHDSTLRLWDTDTGKELRVFASPTGGFLGAALSPDGKRVLSSGGDKTVRLWNADTGQELVKINGPEPGMEIPVDSIAFGPAGQALSGGGYADGTLRVWDLNTGKQAAVFKAGGYAVGVAYSAKARLAATYTWTKIRLWDLEAGKEVRSFAGHTSFVTSVCFSPDGERVLSSGWDGRVLVWDVQSGKVLQQVRTPTHEAANIDGSEAACCAAFSPDGKRIVFGGKGAHVWDVESGNEVYKFEGHTAGVTGVAWFPDGKRIASASGDGAVRVWLAPEMPKEAEKAPAKKKAGQVFKAPGSHTHDVALSTDGKMLARAGSGQIDGWEVASGKQLHTLKGQPHFYKTAFSPDGKTLASIGGDVTADKYEVAVKLWDVATGKERVLGKGQPIKAGTMAFSPDSKTLATSYLEPAAVKLWDVATGKEKMELAGAWGSLAFSPEGKTLAVGDRAVQLWDLTTGKKRASLARDEDWLDVRPLAYSDSLAFSPDSKTVVSAGLHKGEEGHSARLTVWDVPTAKERAIIAIPGFSAPNAPPLVFTADGQTLITAVWIFEDDNNTNGRVSVQHWDVATGKARATYWTPVYPGGDPALDASNVAGFYFAALSADGKTVAWGGAEGDKGVTFEPARPVVKNPGEVPKFTIRAAKDAALGDFAIAVRAPGGPFDVTTEGINELRAALPAAKILR